MFGWREAGENFCLYSGWPQLSLAIRQGEGALVYRLPVTARRRTRCCELTDEFVSDEILWVEEPKDGWVVIRIANAGEYERAH